MNKRLSPRVAAVMSPPPVNLGLEQMVASALLADFTEPACVNARLTGREGVGVCVLFAHAWLMLTEIGIPALLNASLSAVKDCVFGLNSAGTRCTRV